MAVARVDAALTPGEGKATSPTPESQSLLHGTKLNSYLVVGRSLGLGVQFCTNSFWCGAVGVAEPHCPLGVVVPGCCLALRLCGEGRTGDYIPRVLRAAGRFGSRASEAAWVVGFGLRWPFLVFFTLNSERPSENCRIPLFGFTRLPYLLGSCHVQENLFQT